MTQEDTRQQARRARHGAELAAPAGLLYDLVADASRAPLVFPGTVHVEILERGAGTERLRIWAAQGDGMRTWVSRRELDPATRTVAFQQETPEPPIACMRGEWHFEAAGANRTRVTLSHAYRAVGDDPAGIGWIEDMAERISTGQLAALAEHAALGTPVSFEKSAQLRCPAAVAYAFVADAAGYGQLPGIKSCSVLADDGEMQLIGIRGRDRDGQPRDGRVARVCFPVARIVFKDLHPAAGAAAHAGHWQFEDVPGGSRVTVRHTAVVRSAEAGGTAAAQAELGTASAALLSELAARNG